MRRSKAHALHPVNKVKQALQFTQRFLTDATGVLRHDAGGATASLWDYAPVTPDPSIVKLYHRQYDFYYARDVSYTETWDAREVADKGDEVALHCVDWYGATQGHAEVKTGTTAGDSMSYQAQTATAKFDTSGLGVWFDIEFMMPDMVDTEFFVGFADTIDVGDNLFDDREYAYGFRKDAGDLQIYFESRNPLGTFDFSVEPLAVDGHYYHLSFHFHWDGQFGTAIAPVFVVSDGQNIDWADDAGIERHDGDLPDVAEPSFLEDGGQDGLLADHAAPYHQPVNLTLRHLCFLPDCGFERAPAAPPLAPRIQRFADGDDKPMSRPSWV